MFVQKISSLAIFMFIFYSFCQAMLLIPMDMAQRNHLKAYGLVYNAIREGGKIYWLLNYRGGAFLCPNDNKNIMLKARLEGVEIIQISASEWNNIQKMIDENNMEKITLEKAPKIAVYCPPTSLPWDDAVRLVLSYAKIPYDTVYDAEVLAGRLSDYDWLHLHHEDFTGQYSKFYRSFGSSPWYQRQKMAMEKITADLGFKKVSDCKKAVALAIRRYVENGGFLFAMCCAPNTLDIALASLGTDIVSEVYDGDGIDPQYRIKLDFNNCLAFENFFIQTDPMQPYFDNIDVNMVNTPMHKPAADFVLFEFSAKLDPVPCMLIQNHVRTIKGFHGLLTSFNKSVTKKSVVILGYVPGTNSLNYIHGIVGKGQFAFLGGHDPEDYSHAVGDKPTDLALYPNSPGYRLILNNVLFPAAEKKEKKT